MTTPTPEPARAELVGGDTKRLSPLFAASVSSDGKPALQWIGHGRIVLPEGTSVDTLADFVNRIVDLERPVAPAQASDAGLAEVERMIRDHGGALTAAMACGLKDGAVWDHAKPQEDAILSAFAAQAETIAALRADNDRLRAAAAGRGEGVSAAEVEALIEAASAGHDALNAIRDDVFSSAIVTGRNQARGQEAMEKIDRVLRPDAWDRSKDLRARIAAAPAPATDGTGGGSDG
jgi:hypothetical protein